MENNNLSNFVDKIIKLSEPNYKEIEGLIYSDKSLNLIKPPVQTSITMHTLTGLCDFIKNENLKDTILHIVDEDEVHLISDVDKNYKNRIVYAIAKRFEIQHCFNTPLAIEDFIVNLQSKFVQNYAIESVMKFVASLTDVRELTITDNGVTQTVSGTTGIKPLEKDIPKLAALKPFRTFSEVDQPTSDFVLRIKKAGQGDIRAALYEADGGAWRNQAIQNIKEYLEKAKTGCKIIA